MTEDQFLQRVLDTARIHGWRVAHHRPARTNKGYRTATQGDVGVPDLVLARGETVLLAELKTDRGKLRPGQPEWQAAAGAHGRVWRPRDWDAVLAELSAR